MGGVWGGMGGVRPGATTTTHKRPTTLLTLRMATGGVGEVSDTVVRSVVTVVILYSLYIRTGE